MLNSGSRNGSAFIDREAPRHLNLFNVVVKYIVSSRCVPAMILFWLGIKLRRVRNDYLKVMQVFRKRGIGL